MQTLGDGLGWGGETIKFYFVQSCSLQFHTNLKKSEVDSAKRLWDAGTDTPRVIEPLEGGKDDVVTSKNGYRTVKKNLEKDKKYFHHMQSIN